MYNTDDLVWDQDQDEDAAIEQVARELAPRYIIVERSLAAKFPDGSVVKVPLDVSMDKFQAINEMDLSPTEQISTFMDFLGDQAAKETLIRQGFIAFTMFATKYFGLVEKLAAMAPGKPRSSVTSSLSTTPPSATTSPDSGSTLTA